jgi:hypothetical protein
MRRVPKLSSETLVRAPRVIGLLVLLLTMDLKEPSAQGRTKVKRI